MLRTRRIVFSLSIVLVTAALTIGCVPGDSARNTPPDSPKQTPATEITAYSQAQQELDDDFERLQSIRNQTESYLSKWRSLEEDPEGSYVAGPELAAAKVKILDACRDLEAGVEQLSESSYLAEYSGRRDQLEDHLRYIKTTRETVGQ